MLQLTRKDNRITIETMGGILAWDGARGGQLTRLDLKDDLGAHPVAPAGQPWCNLVCRADGRAAALESAPAKLEITAVYPDYLKIAARAQLLDGALQVTQSYEVHEEGAVFCDLALDIPGGRSVRLEQCALETAADLRGCRQARWGYVTRQPKYKRDYSTIHAFATYSLFHPLAETRDEPELLPFISLDLGWEGVRFFSHHLELILEDWTAFNDGPLSQTRTRAGGDGALWRARWFFHDGAPASVAGPWRYRNRWGLLFARARTAGAGADPAIRNNVLGARICHCMYPYARGGERWPWISMPLKQIPEQPPMLFRGHPEPERADEARAAGADTLIMHQSWMRQPGSNNEPPADYQPDDPAWLRAFIARCRERDLRVLLYGRGTEMWLQYSPFFEDFLQPDRDGLYLDWNGPFNMGYLKCSPLHVSLHNYFHFAKALRRRVGPGGALIGHAATPTHVASASFDANLGGEISVRHNELLAAPESAAYFAQLSAAGAHLISGNLPDRAAFSSPRAAALCAALGMASHPFMEPGVAFADRMAFLRPLWQALNSLPGRIARLHNPAYAPTRAVATEARHLYPCLWQAADGRALLLVTNLADTPQSGEVRLDLSALDLPRRAPLEVLALEGVCHSARPDGAGVRLENIPPLQFAAVRFGHGTAS